MYHHGASNTWLLVNWLVFKNIFLERQIILFCLFQYCAVFSKHQHCFCFSEKQNQKKNRWKKKEQKQVHQKQVTCFYFLFCFFFWKNRKQLFCFSFVFLFFKMLHPVICTGRIFCCNSQACIKKPPWNQPKSTNLFYF